MEISKQAKKRARKIDFIRKRNEKKEEESSNKFWEINDFIKRYEICPACSRKLKYRFVLSLINGNDLYKCKKCKRKYKVYLPFPFSYWVQ